MLISTLTAAVKAYQAGTKLADIKQQYGVSSETIYAHLKRRGLPTRLAARGPRWCEECGASLRGRVLTRRYCSLKCQRDYERGIKEERRQRLREAGAVGRCRVCNAELWPKNSSRRANTHYCSREHRRLFEKRKKQMGAKEFAALMKDGAPIAQIAQRLCLRVGDV